MSGWRKGLDPEGSAAAERARHDVDVPHFTPLRVGPRGPRLQDAAEALSCQALVSKLTASLLRERLSPVAQRQLSRPGFEEETQGCRAPKIRPSQTTNHPIPLHDSVEDASPSFTAPSPKRRRWCGPRAMWEAQGAEKKNFLTS
jgi:hypothetical protein